MNLKQFTCLSCAQLFAILLFIFAFFPRKIVLTGISQQDPDEDRDLQHNRPFQKLVFVIIDALRSDFLFDAQISHFNNVHQWLNTGEAWGYTSFANPPTVTLPRLKSITTGSTPSFIDLLLNVAQDIDSNDLSEHDSWLQQFIQHNNTIRFMGDDTWLKLFPHEWFDFADPTHSFFVSDFTQVDNNVTRNLQKKLFQEWAQWDVAILHYLGLDHIGHRDGPHSKFMGTKHQEMDSILKSIYDQVLEHENDDDTLICVLGDHGMNELGNHGGSSAGETSAGLLFLSPKLSRFAKPEPQETHILPINGTPDHDFQYLESVQQIDIVPTIAALFGMPIPMNSVGIIIPDFLQLLPNKLASMKENFMHLWRLSDHHDDVALDDFTINDIYTKMHDIQETLTRSATNYNYPLLAVAFVSFLFTTIVAVYQLQRYSGPSFCHLHISSLSVILVSVILGVSTFASSFIEEEHQLWWWIVTASSVVPLFLYPSNAFVFARWFIMIACVRLIKFWNNSGQKFIYSNVMSNLLNQNPFWKWYLNSSTFLALIIPSARSQLLHFIVTTILVGLCFTYKISWEIVNGNQAEIPPFMQGLLTKMDFLPTENNLLLLARVFFQAWSIVVISRLALTKLKVLDKRYLIEDMKLYITVLLIFQTSSQNIGQFIIFQILQSQIYYFFQHLPTSLSLTSPSEVYLSSLVSLILQNFTFFQFGGTNSISTIDLGNAYHGVSSDYNIYVVGILMSVANFAPAIYWSMLPWSINYGSASSQNKLQTFIMSKMPAFTYHCIFGACLMTACIFLRFHLFIWSVFSPKLCYFLGWNLVMGLLNGWLPELAILFALD
ncbi:mannose-ethanolamine phosphotransferase LAS21 SKDI_10G1520 [Saccharomyces kudriavzevii IFO 1802]|uniref:GPI ethanolamine phosphate transferase 2 n=1 Tax=Saccharomyces kudriavzevii (strain ATCC MYA-4449 / AS 2.2408 / CBS 8840 / NBRC 1802 / NCYC 2889) TaxID=226230 RepID=A0AA35J2E8_SACK1|nr:uncharacterized protein SKDI_10G1520 [Saccharomyces kudriavzevii IFO 1802]CAI4043696.1 hypothetical protein SKDI_10G1520 [Saccharomyces kudriavzevii IFO 1802]